MVAHLQSRTRRWLALGMLASVFVPLVGCGRSSTTDASQVEVSTLDQARSELRSYVEDVTQATASRYGVMDDRGNVMDTVKIIAVPEAGGFAGVYHTYRDDTGAFSVHLATLSDLMNWTWRVELASEASQPTIKPALDGGYVVAWEVTRVQEPDINLRFAYYSSWQELLAGAPAKTFDAPLRLSSCGEGTANLYSASSTFLDVGFHFYANCDLDRQARGATDWRSWSATAQGQIDGTILAHGVEGNIGDRDALSFKGFNFTLIEGQVIKNDWLSWRVFLYDDETGEAEPLNIRTRAGSVAFANPTIELVEIDGQKAILVALYLPGEGAEAGQLIYYRTYEPVDPG